MLKTKIQFKKREKGMIRYSKGAGIHFKVIVSKVGMMAIWLRRKIIFKD